MPIDNCPRCGASLRFDRRTQDETPSGHHNCVFVCPDCDREVVSG